MNPVKFKDVITEAANRSGFRPEQVTAVLLLYYKELRSALTSLSHPRVQVLNLGTFRLKPKMAEKKLSGKRSRLQQCAGEGARSSAVREELLREIGCLEQVLELLQTERERKDFIKQNKSIHHEPAS